MGSVTATWMVVVSASNSSQAVSSELVPGYFISSINPPPHYTFTRDESHGTVHIVGSVTAVGVCFFALKVRETREAAFRITRVLRLQAGSIIIGGGCMYPPQLSL